MTETPEHSYAHRISSQLPPQRLPVEQLPPRLVGAGQGRGLPQRRRDAPLARRRQPLSRVGPREGPRQRQRRRPRQRRWWRCRCGHVTLGVTRCDQVTLGVASRHSCWAGQNFSVSPLFSRHLGSSSCLRSCSGHFSAKSFKSCTSTQYEVFYSTSMGSCSPSQTELGEN